MKKHSLMTSDCLKRWGDYLVCLSAGMQTREARGGLRCKVSLPSGENLIATGEDALHLVRNLLVQLAEALPEPPVVSEHLNAEPVSRCTTRGKQKELEKMVSTSNVQRSTPVDETTKARQETIGVTTKKSLHNAISSLSEKRGAPFSVVARELLQDGIKNFNEAIKTICPWELLQEYERKANAYSGDSEQWMLRSDRKLTATVRLAAKEFERSVSNFTCCLLAESLSNEYGIGSVSHSVPATQRRLASDSTPSDVSEAELQAAYLAVSIIVGPKIRKLAKEIGLGDQPTLMGDILGGAVITPVGVISRIADHMAVSSAALSAVVNDCFYRQQVPAYKAEESKPEISVKRKAWADAVKELRLSREEEERLLSLE